MEAENQRQKPTAGNDNDNMEANNNMMMMMNNESLSDSEESIEVVDASVENLGDDGLAISGDEGEDGYFGEDSGAFMTTSLSASYVNVSHQQKQKENKQKMDDEDEEKMLPWDGNTSQLLRSSTPLLLQAGASNNGGGLQMSSHRQMQPPVNGSGEHHQISAIERELSDGFDMGGSFPPPPPKMMRSTVSTASLITHQHSQPKQQNHLKQQQQQFPVPPEMFYSIVSAGRKIQGQQPAAAGDEGGDQSSYYLFSSSNNAVNNNNNESVRNFSIYQQQLQQSQKQQQMLQQQNQESQYWMLRGGASDFGGGESSSIISNNNNNNNNIDWYRRQLDKRERQLEDAEKRCQEYKSEADAFRKIFVDVKVNNAGSAENQKQQWKGEKTQQQTEAIQQQKPIAELDTAQFGAIRAAFEDLNKKLESYQRDSAEAFRQQFAAFETATGERFASLEKTTAEMLSSSTERNQQLITEKEAALKEINAQMSSRGDQLSAIQRSIEAERVGGGERLLALQQAVEKLDQRLEQALNSNKNDQEEGRNAVVLAEVGKELSAVKSLVGELTTAVQQTQSKIDEFVVAAKTKKQQKQNVQSPPPEGAMEIEEEEEATGSGQQQPSTTKATTTTNTAGSGLSAVKIPVFQRALASANKENNCPVEKVKCPAPADDATNSNNGNQPKKGADGKEVTVRRSNTALGSAWTRSARSRQNLLTAGNKNEGAKKSPFMELFTFDSEEEETNENEDEPEEYSNYYRMVAGMAKIRPMVMPFKEEKCRRYSLKSAFNGAFVGVLRGGRLIAGKGKGQETPIPLVFEQLNKFAQFADCWMRRENNEEQYFIQLEGKFLVSRSAGNYANSQRFSAIVVSGDKGGPLTRLSLLDTEEEIELDAHKDVNRVVTVEEEGGLALIKVVNRPKKQSGSDREALKLRRQELFYLTSMP